MPKGIPGKGKQWILGLLLTLLLYGLAPLLFAWFAVRGWMDAQKLLVPMALSAALSAAVGGLYLTRRGGLSVFIAALLAGPGAQLIAALIGYLAFGRVEWGSNRWLLPVAGFAGALAAGLLFSRRTGRKRTERSRGAGRNRRK
ncbi:MAG: hypothetical protein ACI3W8_02995 [Oscillospiraceae bacterium]